MKNTKRFASMLFAASLAVTVVGCASTDDQASTGQYIDDTVITAKVKASLVDNPQVKATEVNVETYKGAVQLSGFVSDPLDAQKAADIARGVKGVTSVKNDIRVK